MPTVIEQEPMISCALDFLPVSQGHPKNRFYPALDDPDQSRMPQDPSFLVKLPEPHFSDPGFCAKRAGITVGWILKFSPQFLNRNRIGSPVPTSRSTWKIKDHFGSLGQAGGPMSNPLPGDEDWKSDQELVLHHLERRGMPMPHEVANQASVIANGFRPLTVGDAGGLDNRRVVPHVVDESDKSVR
jgi:hypothetical protein